jgi:dTDP-4-amino-4,6-dideoxygalactose transaminase
MISFIDPISQYNEIAHLVEPDVLDCMRKCQFTNGYYLERFEHAIGKYLGVNHVIGLSSGTDAIMLACEGLNIGYGDYVIVANNASITLAFGLSRAGALPIFADVHQDTYLMDTDSVISLLQTHPKKKKIKAIIVSDIFGQMPNFEMFQEIARTFKVLLIEDATHSVGATYKHNHVAWYADAAITSFNPNRNLGTMGQGGAVFTNDSMLSKKIRIIANQGMEKNITHMLGGNYKLDSVFAAHLYHALSKLDEWNDRRRAIAKKYNDYFNSDQRPTQQPCGKHIYHLYQFKCRTGMERDNLERELIAKQIGYSITPNLITESQIYLNLIDTPMAYYLRDLLIALPMHPFLTNGEILEVVQAVHQSCGSSE